MTDLEINKALQAEVERLGFNEMAHLVKIQDMDIAIAQLRAKLFDAEAWVADTEIADTEKDAMRYRKFRDANADQRNRLEHYAGPALDIAIDALAAASNSKGFKMKWLSIDTMPEEGTFLVYTPLERTKVHTCWRNRNGVMIIGGMFAFDITKPTYWMPLPASPTE